MSTGPKPERCLEAIDTLRAHLARRADAGDDVLVNQQYEGQVACLSFGDLRAILESFESQPPTVLPSSERRPAHWYCRTHGSIDAWHAVGCPDCMREAREQLRQLKGRLSVAVRFINERVVGHPTMGWMRLQELPDDVRFLVEAERARLEGPTT